MFHYQRLIKQAIRWEPFLFASFQRISPSVRSGTKRKEPQARAILTLFLLQELVKFGSPRSGKGQPGQAAFLLGSKCQGPGIGSGSFFGACTVVSTGHLRRQWMSLGCGTVFWVLPSICLQTEHYGGFQQQPRPFERVSGFRKSHDPQTGFLMGG